MTATTDPYSGVPRPDKQSRAKALPAHANGGNRVGALSAPAGDDGRRCASKAQVLRFVVFNLELREGLEQIPLRRVSISGRV